MGGLQSQRGGDRNRESDDGVSSKDPQLLRDLELFAIMDSNRELAAHKVKAKQLRA